MRSEQEVAKLVATLERHNEVLEKQMAGLTTDGEAFDESAGAFNSNAKLLCALYWVLGNNTINVRGA